MDIRASDAGEGLDLLSRAISFSHLAHQGQFRKDKITPYAAHPMRVLMLMMRVFGVEDPEVLAAAALHDTIEDTTTDRDELIERFGERVAGYVAELSKDTRLPETEREKRYFDGLAKAPLEVKLVKLGDTLDNLHDSKSISSRSREKAIGKARELIGLFEPSVPDSWSHALAAVREKIRSLETEANP